MASEAFRAVGHGADDAHAARAKATWAIVASLAAHLAVVGVVSSLAYRSLSEREASEATWRAAGGAGEIAIELPGVADGTLASDHEVVPEGEAPERFGGAAIARVDTGSPGAGGDVTGARATNLAALSEDLKLDTDLLSRLDRDQVQRLRTARLRTTREDRRSTTRPMELTFLASGTGEVAERRPDARSNPSRGSLKAGEVAVVGGEIGSGEERERGEGVAAGAERSGEREGSPGMGVRRGRPGEDHRRSARIAFARPAVAEGEPSIPGVWRGRPNDTVDSEQEVANAVRSLVHASVAGGVSGEGCGGSGAGTSDPGAGGGPLGRGSVASPLGSGDGALVDWNTRDPLLLPYFRRVHAKIEPLWRDAFPKSAILELKQGTVILEFSIAADGSAKVTWPPVRRSGIDEFDRNCADAIRRASPFEPLPPALRAGGRTAIRVRAPFVAKNPMVR